MSKQRIQALEPPYETSIRETLASMMPPGVEPLLLFRTLARNPRILEKIRAGNLLDRGSIERADRELAILRTCARCGSEYEWGVHVSVFARRFGIEEAKIAGTLEWRGDDARWTPHEGAIVQLVDELHERSTIGEPLWRALEEQFAADQIVELLVLVGFYHTISFVINGLQIELEPSGERFADFTSSPRTPHSVSA
jgi:4-carboxymuconolactone decarboxylase